MSKESFRSKEFDKLHTDIQDIIVKRTIKSFLIGFMVGVWVVVISCMVAS